MMTDNNNYYSIGNKSPEKERESGSDGGSPLSAIEQLMRNKQRESLTQQQQNNHNTHHRVFNHYVSPVTTASSPQVTSLNQSFITSNNNNNNNNNKHNNKNNAKHKCDDEENDDDDEDDQLSPIKKLTLPTQSTQLVDNNNNNNYNNNNNNNSDLTSTSCSTADLTKRKKQQVTLSDSEKLAKLWPGNNYTPCGGRWIIGPDTKQIGVTITLILIPFLLFEAFEASYFILLHPVGYIVLVVPLLALVYIMFALFMTAVTDPGILPRRCVITNNMQNENPDVEEVTKQYPPLFQTVYVNGEELVLKFCYTCEIYRPPRTSHCPRCDNCVEKFDHHCPWTGTCIGKRNYRAFSHFVTSTTIALLTMIALCVFQIVYSCVTLAKTYPFRGDAPTVWKIICTAGSVPIILFCLGALGFVGSLFGYHGYLICTNQTTYEAIKKRRGRDQNKFNRGPLRNFFNDFLLAPCEPSRIPFRKPLSEYRQHVAVMNSSLYSAQMNSSFGSMV